MTENHQMPPIADTIIYMLAFLAGPPAMHWFAIWYSKSFRWLTSSIVIQAVFFTYWLAQHPNAL